MGQNVYASRSLQLDYPFSAAACILYPPFYVIMTKSIVVYEYSALLGLVVLCAKLSLPPFSPLSRHGLDALDLVQQYHQLPQTT